jgi:uncharacterized protein (DUF1697 family)
MLEIRSPTAPCLVKKNSAANSNLDEAGREPSMPAYIAMLRGINVSGHNTIKMEHLRALCSDLGFRNVETYVQSGNIVFQTGTENPSNLSRRISEKILLASGFDVPVILRSSIEMRSVIANNPFLKEKGIDSSKLHVTFLSETVQESVLKRLEPLSKNPDRSYGAPQEIYLYCPGGYGRTKLSNNAIEKALSVRTTTRNWKTTNTLLEMVSKL